MSDGTLALIIMAVLLTAVFLCVPLLQFVEAFARRYPARYQEEMPDLVEEAYSARFTGDVL